MHAKRCGAAWYHWFTESDTPEERKLLLKLDLLIVPYSFIGFWINYIDASNISQLDRNAPGLSKDLKFFGNELVDFQTIAQVGSVIGQLPFAYLFPLLPMHWLIPSMELLWGVFTLLQYRANSYAELMAYRFFIGFFEASFFIGVHYVLGSWYRGDELGRRGGLFYVGLTLGSLTAGLIQSSASANLEGVAGLAGWRWMFIIVALMTFVVAIAGVIVWPGTPDIPNRLFLSKTELALVRDRLQRKDNVEDPAGNRKVTIDFLKSIFTSWKVYVITFWNILFWNSDPQPWGGYLLWIDSLGRYSAAEVNRLGASAPGIGILSDLWLGRTGAIVLAHVVNIMSMTILVVWNVPESAKWFAFNIYYFDIGMSSVLYGWANDILRHDKKERAIILVVMNVAPSAIRAWIGLLVFKTVEAPRFTKGYSFCLAASISLIFWTFLVRHLYKKQEDKIKETEFAQRPNSIEESPSDHDTKNPAHSISVVVPPTASTGIPLEA
ncbi:MFS transporter (Seo1) [Kalmusia sp. IMI 367209]|nr:MFS transporter (Seo1) [Kalmusia sp. IMI 367209]